MLSLALFISSVRITAPKYYMYVLYTKRTDAIPSNLMKYRIREIRCYNDRIALKCDKYLGSSAVKFQSNWKSLKPIIAALRLDEILRQDVRPLSEQRPRIPPRTQPLLSLVQLLYNTHLLGILDDICCCARIFYHQGLLQTIVKYDLNNMLYRPGIPNESRDTPWSWNSVIDHRLWYRYTDCHIYFIRWLGSQIVPD